MTPLEEVLVARISRTGPITVAEYMAECLSNPTHGYYANRDPLGVAGDFTTAPEISQMFGECIGLALAQAWLDQGAPGQFALAELGPGRGTLMADVLRATRAVPGFLSSADLHLVETSPVLRTAQAATLRGQSPFWHDTVASLPEKPLFLIANEFFDALPARQFIRDGSGWRERMVGIDKAELSFGLSPISGVADLTRRLEDTGDGDVVETRAQATTIAQQVGARIAAHGGVAFFIDYGDWRSLGDTLQAVQGHSQVDPLDSPGHADLTVHVDFEALAKAASPAAHTRLVPQGVLLQRLGIAQRAQMLAQKLEGDGLQSHIAAFHRLTDAQEMGTLFKALAIFQAGGPTPPGFET